jgi:hypothetical protein
MSAKQFFEAVELINSPGILKTACGNFTVLNVGTSTAYINGISLLTGEQYIVYANENEMNVSNYQLSFDNSGTNVVQVIRKIFNS